MQQAQLTLLNETDSPTRHGNSVERDTTPDLAFIKGRLSAQWVNTHDTLTSDHTVIKMFLQIKGFPKRQRKHRLTDWNEFRKTHVGDFQNMHLKDWVEMVRQRIQSHTKEIIEKWEQPSTDRHLLHLWEARHASLRDGKEISSIENYAHASTRSTSRSSTTLNISLVSSGTIRATSSMTH